MVVACHSGFLLNVFNSVIEFGAGDAAERMGKWFETGAIAIHVQTIADESVVRMRLHLLFLKRYQLRY